MVHVHPPGRFSLSPDFDGDSYEAPPCVYTRSTVPVHPPGRSSSCPDSCSDSFGPYPNAYPHFMVPPREGPHHGPTPMATLMDHPRLSIPPHYGCSSPRGGPHRGPTPMASPMAHLPMPTFALWPLSTAHITTSRIRDSPFKKCLNSNFKGRHRHQRSGSGFSKQVLCFFSCPILLSSRVICPDGNDTHREHESGSNNV